MENNIVVTRSMVRKFSLIMILLITIWGGIQQWLNSIDKEEALHKYDTEQKALLAREKNASEKRDSIYQVSQNTSKEVVNLKNEVEKTRIETKISNEKYQQSINNLKKFKNEKEFINTSATTQQQFDYLSSYKYQPY